MDFDTIGKFSPLDHTLVSILRPSAQLAPTFGLCLAQFSKTPVKSGLPRILHCQYLIVILKVVSD
jgi:hypothetical protein